MKVGIVFLIIGLTTSLPTTKDILFPKAKAQTFVHPGLLNNQAELDFIKDQGNNNKEPWKNEV